MCLYVERSDHSLMHQMFVLEMLNDCITKKVENVRYIEYSKDHLVNAGVLILQAHWIFLGPSAYTHRPVHLYITELVRKNVKKRKSCFENSD